MRVFIAGLGAAVVFALIAAAILRTAQDPAHEAYASSSVRIGEPGTNLVGKGWSGNPDVRTINPNLSQAPKDVH